MTQPWLLAVPVLVICWSNCVLTLPLNREQHTALMSVYDALGESLVDSDIRLRFISGFFSSGCDSMVCPRFDAQSDCDSETSKSSLGCDGGNVTRLFVSPAVFVVFLVLTGSLQ
jgi:hypothetical protein